MASGERRREAEEAEESDAREVRVQEGCLGLPATAGSPSVWGDNLPGIGRLLSVVVFARAINVAETEGFGSWSDGQKGTGF